MLILNNDGLKLAALIKSEYKFTNTDIQLALDNQREDLLNILSKSDEIHQTYKAITKARPNIWYRFYHQHSNLVERSFYGLGILLGMGAVMLLLKSHSALEAIGSASEFIGVNGVVGLLLTGIILGFLPIAFSYFCVPSILQFTEYKDIKDRQRDYDDRVRAHYSKQLSALQVDLDANVRFKNRLMTIKPSTQDNQFEHQQEKFIKLEPASIQLESEAKASNDNTQQETLIDIRKLENNTNLMHNPNAIASADNYANNLLDKSSVPANVEFAENKASELSQGDLIEKESQQAAVVLQSKKLLSTQSFLNINRFYQSSKPDTIIEIKDTAEDKEKKSTKTKRMLSLDN